MNLWIVLFALGLFGLATTSTKLATTKQRFDQSPFVVEKDNKTVFKLRNMKVD